MKMTHHDVIDKH